MHKNLSVVIVLAITIALLVSGCGHSEPSASRSTEMVETKMPMFPTESDPTAATEETQPADPILYPEEMVQYQLPDIETEYLQTDIYTTVDNNIFYDSLVYTG